MKVKEFEVKFLKEGMKRREAVCKYFGWGEVHLTVNGHCTVRVREEHLEVFERAVLKGLFSIIKRR